MSFTLHPFLQSLGDGLAALLFCLAVWGLCWKVKALAWRVLRREKPQAADRGGDRPPEKPAL